ncbi:MAG: hypothetical protein A3J72_09415 [Nitrospirae bacterium RIFCSPHIGHO2_02_FULL_40_19]|nr:MAG: hypothetical protein A3J72_09415 [Nitrospirae bacterium RIFCSPHIGHO2_02_FULL_40_19]
MRIPFAMLILLVFSYGCSNIPFQKTSYVPLDSVDPWTIVRQFRNNSPENFQLVNTIVFQYSWNKFSGIGYIKGNIREKTFTVVCINPIGIKLFELSGNKYKVDSHFVLEQFSKKGDFAKAVGDDIRRIYFDTVPSSGAKIKKKKFQIVFTELLETGIVEYIFAGPGGYLVEKNYYEEGILNWKVSYYEYQQNNEKIYPAGIILKNYKYGYTLTIKLKEIQV